MANDITYLPIDQRYKENEIDKITNAVKLK